MSSPSATPTARLWCDAEPRRLERDRAEIQAFVPSLRYVPAQEVFDGVLFQHGGWAGTLPVWPFDRPAPKDLALLVPQGLEMHLRYSAAYPMTPPLIVPIRPQPTLAQRTQAAWHVLPGGGLCLFQSDGAWIPESSVVELLGKAAGWNIEYALMQVGAIDKMSTCGIANDHTQDGLLPRALELAQGSHG